MNSTIKTDLTAFEVEQLLQTEYQRLLAQQNENLMLQRLQDPSYNLHYELSYDYIYAFTWTGSVKISVSSVRNELGESFSLEDFVRNRSVPSNFYDTYLVASHFPSA